MIQMLKSQNPDKEYPSNLGKKWTAEEEHLLLDELAKNIDAESIAKLHDRTIGGIICHIREIAYKMHIKDVSIEEIMEKTRLCEDEIIDTINRKNASKKVKVKSKPKEEPKPFSIESEIYGIKHDIKELKNTLTELVEMMKAVYVFEDA